MSVKGLKVAGAINEVIFLAKFSSNIALAIILNIASGLGEQN